MDCNICFEDFNQETRVPKVAPCGHTVCLQCLLQIDVKECPTCRTKLNSSPASLPTNFVLLRLMERAPDGGAPGWCSECRAPAAPRCRDGHSVVSTQAALSRHLPEAMVQRAAGQLQDLLRQCEEPLTLLTLLTAGAWDVTLRSHGEERVLTGTVADNDDPVVKLMWLALASRAGVTEIRPTAPPAPSEPTAARTPPNAGRRPGPPTAPKPTATVRAPPPVRAEVAQVSQLIAKATGAAQRSLNVERISASGHNEMHQGKEVALQVARGVVRLVGVSCDEDPIWSLRLLRLAAPTVEQLSVNNPGKAHLREVLAMPVLARLSVWSTEPAQDDTRPLPLPPGGDGGLRWLRVGGAGLPRATLQSLLQANGHTLEELCLTVGTAGDEVWPWSCGDLHVLLQRCRLRALTRLVLRRWNGYTSSHNEADCYRQRISVQEVLPRAGVGVLCSDCDHVEQEEF